MHEEFVNEDSGRKPALTTTWTAVHSGQANSTRLSLISARMSRTRTGRQRKRTLRSRRDEVKPAWFVVHCYSGYENKVKKNLEHRAESMGMTTHILEVIVPTEEQVELKEGQRRVVERRIYPGYVLVKMILDEESWYVVRNTPGVTGFVGIGNKPTPLRQEEVDRIMRRMEAEEPVAQVKVKVGDKVRIVEGNFLDFTGTVDEVYPDKGKARVLVSFFNRETPVEVDLLQIERL